MVVSRFANGLPALLGVLVGVGVFHRGIGGIVIIIALAGAAVISRLLARRLVGRKPTAAAGVIEGWILMAVALVAASTSVILGLTLHLPAVLVGSEAEVNAIAGAIVGAVTAYFATTWTKEIEATNGIFATGAAFKTILQDAFRYHPDVPARQSPAYEAIYDERMSDGTRGWSRAARIGRARSVAKHLGRSRRGTGSNTPSGT